MGWVDGESIEFWWTEILGQLQVLSEAQWLTQPSTAVPSADVQIFQDRLSNPFAHVEEANATTVFAVVLCCLLILQMRF